jgi:hypothetical protein
MPHLAPARSAVGPCGSGSDPILAGVLGESEGSAVAVSQGFLWGDTVPYQLFEFL